MGARGEENFYVKGFSYFVFCVVVFPFTISCIHSIKILHIECRIPCIPLFICVCVLASFPSFSSYSTKAPLQPYEDLLICPRHVSSSCGDLEGNLKFDDLTPHIIDLSALILSLNS